MSLWYKRAGVSNMMIQPIRAQPGYISPQCWQQCRHWSRPLGTREGGDFCWFPHMKTQTLSLGSTAGHCQPPYLLGTEYSPGKSLSPPLGLFFLIIRLLHTKSDLKCSSLDWVQSGPLDVEIISEELIVMLRQLSYAIKNQLKAPKAPY